MSTKMSFISCLKIDIKTEITNMCALKESKKRRKYKDLEVAKVKVFFCTL